MSTGNTPDPITVVLCDDHELFRHGLAEMLTTAEDIRVVGEGNTHERAVTIVSQTRPDVVLLDLQMPGGPAETTLRKMLALPRPPRIVIVTMYGEPRLIRRFIGMGAIAYLAKSASLAELLGTVRSAAASPYSPPDESEARVRPRDVPTPSEERSEG